MAEILEGYDGLGCISAEFELGFKISWKSSLRRLVGADFWECAGFSIPFIPYEVVCCLVHISMSS